MPTVTQYPNEIGSLSGWDAQPPEASKVVAVGSNDGDSTYVEGDVGARQRFLFPSLPSEAFSVNSCTLWIRAKRTGAGSLAAFDGSATVSVADPTTSYTLRSVPFGGPLTVSGVNAAELGLLHSGSAGERKIRCTEMFRETSYSLEPNTFEYTSDIEEVPLSAESGFSFQPSGGPASFNYSGDVTISLDTASTVSRTRAFVADLGTELSVGTVFRFQVRGPILVQVEDRPPLWSWGFSARRLALRAAAALRGRRWDGSLAFHLTRPRRERGGDPYQWSQRDA